VTPGKTSMLKLGRILFEDRPDVLIGDDRRRRAYLD
jgi:hypothetical protein